MWTLLVWGGKPLQTLGSGLWKKQDLLLTSLFVSLKQQRDHGLLLLSWTFHNSKVFFRVPKYSSALNWKRMLDCLERSFLQVLVPVVLSSFPEVLIYIHPTQGQEKESIFHLKKRVWRNKTVWNKSWESTLQSSLLALLVQLIRHAEVFTFPIWIAVHIVVAHRRVFGFCQSK